MAHKKRIFIALLALFAISSGCQAMDSQSSRYANKEYWNKQQKDLGTALKEKGRVLFETGAELLEEIISEKEKTQKAYKTILKKIPLKKIPLLAIGYIWASEKGAQDLKDNIRQRFREAVDLMYEETYRFVSKLDNKNLFDRFIHPLYGDNFVNISTRLEKPIESNLDLSKIQTILPFIMKVMADLGSLNMISLFNSKEAPKFLLFPITKIIINSFSSELYGDPTTHIKELIPIEHREKYRNLNIICSHRLASGGHLMISKMYF